MEAKRNILEVTVCTRLARKLCTQKKNFGMRCNVKEEDLSLITAPILHCTTSNRVSDTTIYQIHTAFVPQCAFDESFMEELFTYTEHSLQNFVIAIIA